ncbi:uncharacterized protein PV09_05034 [Verruconis gallopava]|uniref:Uncharacterized protein n=1 Tax=Verruconis gallopava TaxID=253628 RepID=A0A0D2AAU2_9PEZI|nr:uncharacterized protein PV09_05034 [Verruconis gallopava]KIW03725.1 hypothetical protein PV09_05034 [Verruconis gallopava]
MFFSSFNEPLSTVFKFQSAPAPQGPLRFKRKSHRLSPKRSRPVADVDDLLSESKKKRRLRLFLITSRLSQPFSTPATHIVDPGTSKIAVWAKQRNLTQQVLRKAAIMNRVRRKTLERKDSGVSVGEDEKREVREAMMSDMPDARTTTNCLGPNAILSPENAGCVPSSTSTCVLGLSNYDALDEEDDWFERYHGEEEGDPTSSAPTEKQGAKKEEKSYYSDWSASAIQTKNDSESDSEDDDPFHFNVLSSELVKEKRPPSPPEGRILELIKEKERQREITAGFLHFG